MYSESNCYRLIAPAVPLAPYKEFSPMPELSSPTPRNQLSLQYNKTNLTRKYSLLQRNETIEKREGEGCEILVSPKEPGISQFLRRSRGKASYIASPRGSKELVDLVLEAIEFVDFARRKLQ
jgi:hypothetical protein